MLADLLVDLWHVARSNQSAVLLVLTILLLAYKLVLFPFFISPLKNIPGPYLHRISHIPSLEAQRKHQWIEIIHLLHAKYGEVVLLSPTAVSCNGDPKYINDIYVKNMPKHKFYENFRNHGFKDNIFALLENDRHVKYKRLVQNLYLKSAVFNPKNSLRENVIDKVGDLVKLVYRSSVSGQEPDMRNARLLLNEHGKGHKLQSSDWFKPQKLKYLGIDVYSLFGLLAMDVVSAFELGIENGTHLLQDPAKRDILVPHRMQAGMVFWTTLMPRFWSWAAGPEIRKASEEIEEWQLNLYAQAEENVPQPKDGENLTTLETFKKNGFKGKYAYTFLSDNIFAGHETTAIQLTYMCYELSRPANRERQQMLRRELQEAFGVLKGVDDIITDLEKVDKLPYLEALMQENSRVHTSIPGSEPRVTDKPYVVSVDKGTRVELPVGTQISCQPYSMHRVESVFPQADLWIPERWLQREGETEPQYKLRMMNMQRYMMPFGKGIRMCLGMNLAVIEMKLALANLYWKFSSDICRDWCDVVESDEKIGSKIEIGSRHMTSSTDEKMMTMVDAYTTRPYYDECWLEWLDA